LLTQPRTWTHTGWLPVLVENRAYRGSIFANPCNDSKLTTILLKDSAHLQQEDTLHAQIQ